MYFKASIAACGTWMKLFIQIKSVQPWGKM